MNLDKLAISLLSFGETGMELISSQEVDGIDMDHVSMIGNFYSNVLGAADQLTGLFGPLPVAYRYDLLVFLYAFNAFDPNLKDERVIRNNSITRASLLIFFPTNFDNIFSNQKKNFSNIIDQWAKLFTTNDIRKVKIDKLNNLKENLMIQVVNYTNNTNFSLNSKANLVKIIGKHIFFLETISFLYQKTTYVKFLSNSEKLELILKRSIFLENIDNILEFSNSSNILQFNLHNTTISLNKLPKDEKNIFHALKNSFNGIFLFFEIDEKAANSDFFISLTEKILNFSPKDTMITFCTQIDRNSVFQIEKSSIPFLLSNQINRSISLVDLNSKNLSLELALIDFFEKMISNN
jgi:hypothetical protein